MALGWLVDNASTKKAYQLPLSLPMFTMLTAMETGHGPVGVWAWQIGNTVIQQYHLCAV